MNPKKNPLDKKIATGYSISRRTTNAFKNKCAELGINPSRTTEELQLNFIRSLEQ